MAIRTGFIRTLLMGAVVVMMGCSSIGAQHRPHHATVEVRFYGQHYFTPYRYQAYRYQAYRYQVYRLYERAPVVYKSPPRGVISRSRVAPRPNPQRSRSMNQRPERRPERQRPQRSTRRQRRGN